MTQRLKSIPPTAVGKKLIWIQFNRDRIKPLGFDSRSNTSSWRLFFKSSVSYPHFWPQNSFSTYQQMNCSLRILKTLHFVRIRSCCFAMMQCFENWGVICQITRSQTIMRQSPCTKVSKALSRMTECNNNKISIKKCNCYDKVPKYCNPLAFHCQDLIVNILCCLFWTINVMWINVE